MTKDDYGRIIHTNLFSAKAKEVCDSVLGQLSDGWGENNSRYDVYWKFGTVDRLPDGEVVIVISKKDYEFNPCSHRYSTTGNGFKNMSDDEVKEFFARMIKKTATMELRDGHISNGWKRHNTDTRTVYLQYNEQITFAEVYAIYEHLLGREISSKYAQSIIKSAIGTRRDAETTARATEIADKKNALEKQYSERRKVIDDAEKAEIEAIKKKYQELRTAAYNDYRDSLKSMEEIQYI